MVSPCVPHHRTNIQRSPPAWVSSPSSLPSPHPLPAPHGALVGSGKLLQQPLVQLFSPTPRRPHRRSPLHHAVAPAASLLSLGHEYAVRMAGTACRPLPICGGASPPTAVCKCAAPRIDRRRSQLFPTPRCGGEGLEVVLRQGRDAARSLQQAVAPPSRRRQGRSSPTIQLGLGCWPG